MKKIYLFNLIIVAILLFNVSNITIESQYISDSKYEINEKNINQNSIIGIETKGWKYVDNSGRKIEIEGYTNRISGTSFYETLWFEWNIPDNKIPALNIYSKNFTTQLSQLTRGQTYQYRAAGQYRIDDVDYGNWVNCYPGIPIVKTIGVEDYGLDWAILKGELTHLGGASNCKVKFRVFANRGAYVKSKTVYNLEKYSINVTSLTPGEDYSFYATAENDAGESSGSSLMHIIPGNPEIITLTATNITTNSATLNGILSDMHGREEVIVSFKYGESEDNIVKSTGDPIFLEEPIKYKKELTGLSDDTTYYYKAISYKYGDGQGEGEILSFRTSNGEIKSDLQCEGDIDLDQIKPGELLYHNVIIRNIGNPYSELDWEILTKPDWGNWIFNPFNGLNLKPEDGDLLINITITAPYEENKRFEGQIEIINKEKSQDKCIIPVTMNTRKEKKICINFKSIKSYLEALHY